MIPYMVRLSFLFRKILRGDRLEGLYRVVRGDTLTYKGHPYIFF